MKKFKKVLFFLLSGVIIIPVINKYIAIININFNTNLGLYVSIGVWLALILLIILLKKTIDKTKENLKIEVEGINLKNKDGTFGTADWGTKEEISEYLGIGKRNGIILGQTSEGELITLPLDTYLNKNIVVFGSSGSKKSRGFAIPNAIELAQETVKEVINKDMSFVITDPKR